MLRFTGSHEGSLFPYTILAEASSYITTYNIDFEEHLEKMMKVVSPKGKLIEPSFGDLGETSIAAALLYSLDIYRKNKIGKQSREYDLNNPSELS